MTSTDSSAVVPARRPAAASNTAPNAKRTKAAPPPRKISKGWAKASVGTKKIHAFFGGGRNLADTAPPATTGKITNYLPPKSGQISVSVPGDAATPIIVDDAEADPAPGTAHNPIDVDTPMSGMDDNNNSGPNTGMASGEITGHNTDIPVATSLDDLVSIDALENDTDHSMRHQVPATVSVATSTSNSTPSTSTSVNLMHIAHIAPSFVIRAPRIPVSAYRRSIHHFI